ncbi:MAG: cytochrome b/b6 domain-containing protein, partial [Candidatus Hadarchaeota archaeon]
MSKLYQTGIPSEKPKAEKRHVDYGSIEVKRHSTQYRVYHWAIVATGLILGWTGLRLGGIYGVSFPDMQLSLTIHVYLGFVFAGLFVLLFAYVIAHEWKWFTLARIPYATKFFILELLSWFKLIPHVEDPRGYNDRKKEYVEKLVPTEVIVLWLYIVLVLIMGITGLPLYYTDILEPITQFAGQFAGFFNFADGEMLLRAVHQLFMFIF